MTSRRLLDPVSKSLLDAADYIEKHGHCKGLSHDQYGRVCIIGALRTRGFALASASKLRNYLNISLKFGGVVQSVADWNDAPERTAEEVIAALRGAAVAQ